MKKLLLLIISFSGWIFAEQFVLPKKKRISTRALQENIGRCCGDCIKLLNKQINFCSQIEAFFMANTEELLEQDNSGFFAKASGQELLEYEKSVEHFRQIVSDCNQKMQKAYEQISKKSGVEQK